MRAQKCRNSTNESKTWIFLFLRDSLDRELVLEVSGDEGDVVGVPVGFLDEPGQSCLQEASSKFKVQCQ